MKRFLCSFLSVLFVIGIWCSVPVTASAANADVKYLGTYNIEEQINPLYKGLVDESTELSSKPDVYYSDGSSFDISDCSSDKEVSAKTIREAMEARNATATIYYTAENNVQLSDDEINALFKELLELAMVETDKATQGDSLRYGYKSAAADIIYKYTADSKYYYQYTYNFTYYTTAAQEAELTTEVNNLITQFAFDENTTEKEKSDIIYNYITTNVTYDQANLEDESYTLKFTPYAALINKTAVCQGYAMLYYRLAEETGLDCRIVSGTSRDQNHAWNIVKIGDYYYYLDSTWDAGNLPSTYQYYLKGSTSFSQNHTNEEFFETEEFKNTYSIFSDDYVNETIIGIENNFKYSINNNVATVTKYIGTETDVTVPSNLGGAPVYYISALAFDKVETMTSLTFSEGIKSMESTAINTCTNLTTINFPSTMTIGFERYNDPIITGYSTAPIYCDAVKTVTIAETNPYIKVKDGIIYTVDESAVVYCPPALNITDITLSDEVIDIAPRAFDSSYKLESIKLPQNLKGIGELAFCNCTALKTLTLPDDCVYLGQFAFINSALDTINIPEGMQRISGNTFQNTLLKNITVDENSAFKLYDGALCLDNTLYVYDKGTGATSYTVPEAITVIEQCAFQNSDLEEIVLHNNITTINSYAFANCKKLVHVSIPSSLTVIDNYLFLNCDDLASIFIPDNVTDIGELVFYDNKDFTIYYETTGSKAYDYANTNQIKSKPISEFKCTDGHNMAYVCDEKGYRYTCSVCGDSSKNNPLKSISGATGTLVETEFIYGNINPVIKSVTYGDEVLVENEDYTVSNDFGIYPGEQWLTITGINEFCDTLKIPFYVTKADISNKEVTLSFYEHEYCGYELEPTVTIDGLEKGVDYEVEISDNINVGTATVTIKGATTHYGTITKTFEIVAKDITPLEDYITLENTYYEYDGTAKCPAVTFFDLKEDTDITISYSNNINAGTAIVTLTGIGNYKGTISATYIIGTKYVESSDVKLEYTTVVYDGNAKCPKVSINGLIEGVDYDVEYSNNTAIGYANACVTCKGNYTGVFNLEFQIIQKTHTHSYTSTVTKQPTCIATGVKTFTCSCGNSYTETIPATGAHNQNTKIAGKAATCTATGLTDGAKCSVCGKVTVEQKEIAKLAHNTNTKVPAVAATCTATGLTEGAKCSVCGTVTKAQETVPATGHKEVVIPAVAPTFTAVGKTEGKKCSVCGTVTVAQKDVEKLTFTTPVVAIKNTAKGIEVSWNTIENAQNYIVYRRVYNASTKKWSGWSKIKTGYTGTSYVDGTVTLGTQYKYTVRAVNGTVMSEYKSTSTLKYNVTPTVKISNVATGVKVTWSTAANATGYTVYRSQYSNGKWSGWKSMGTAKSTKSSWTDKNVKSGVQYKYTVRACYNKIKSSYKGSNVTIFLTQPTVKFANASTGIKVSWSKVSGATGYTVYRSQLVDGKWTNWKSMGTAKSTKSSWTDKKVESGATYKYTVRAVSGKYKSSYTDTKGLLYLAQPTVTVKAVSNGINVAWSQCEGATGYTVYRSEYNTKTKKWSKWKSMGTAKATKSNWTDKKATKGVKYKYTVRAVNADTGSKSTYVASKEIKR